MPEDMSDRMPEDMPDRMPEDLPDRMPEDMPDHMPEDMPDRMPNRLSEDMSDRMPEDLPVRKCINVMVGITRSKVIFLVQYMNWVHSIDVHTEDCTTPIIQNYIIISINIPLYYPTTSQSKATFNDDIPLYIPWYPSPTFNNIPYLITLI